MRGEVSHSKECIYYLWLGEIERRRDESVEIRGRTLFERVEEIVGVCEDRGEFLTGITCVNVLENALDALEARRYVTCFEEELSHLFVNVILQCVPASGFILLFNRHEASQRVRMKSNFRIVEPSEHHVLAVFTH